MYTQEQVTAGKCDRLGYSAVWFTPAAQEIIKRIIALNRITQLRIAQYIGCAPKEAAELPRKPEIAYLQGNRIVIEDYNKMKNMLVDFIEGT